MGSHGPQIRLFGKFERAIYTRDDARITARCGGRWVDGGSRLQA